MKAKLFLAWFLVLGLLAGCARPAPTPTPAAPAPGPAATPTPKAPGPTPPLAVGVKPAGELRVAVGYVGTETLDPIMGPSSGLKFLAEQIYDYLVGPTLDGKLSTETGLAFKWEMTPDAKRWTFFLRKGVKFHNGEEVTAEDVKFSLERAASERSISTYALTFRQTIERMETPDPHTLVLYLKTPEPLFVYYLSPLVGAEAMIVPKKYLQQVGDEEFARKPIGSGLYRFKEQVHGSYVRYEAVDSHWRETPYFKSLTLLSIPEPTTRIAALKLGQVDIIELERESLAEIKKAGFRVAEIPFNTDAQFRMFQQWDPVPVADKRVRLALNHAINRQEILEHIFANMGTVGTTGFHAPFSVGYDQNLKPYPYDPERAKKLLEEAGQKGLTITIHAYTRPGLPELPKVAEAIAGYFDKIGVKAKIIPTEYGSFRSKWRGRKIPGEVSTHGVDNRFWTQPTLLRYFNLEDELAVANRPDINATLEKAGRTLNDKEREELMRQAYRMIYDDAVLPSLAQLSKLLAFGPKIDTYTPRPVAYSLALDRVTRQK